MGPYGIGPWNPPGPDAITPICPECLLIPIARWAKAVSDMCKADDLPPARPLTSSEEKAIRSYEKRIEEHQKKMDDFINNPTIRPGMENLSPEAIAAQQARRVDHLQKEINTFTKLDFIQC
jgi:hypothetical protein